MRQWLSSSRTFSRSAARSSSLLSASPSKPALSRHPRHKPWAIRDVPRHSGHSLDELAAITSESLTPQVFIPSLGPGQSETAGAVLPPRRAHCRDTVVLRRYRPDLALSQLFPSVAV